MLALSRCAFFENRKFYYTHHMIKHLMKDIRGCLYCDLCVKIFFSRHEQGFHFYAQIPNGLLIISLQLGKTSRVPELIWFCIWEKCFTLITQKSGTAWPTKNTRRFQSRKLSTHIYVVFFIYILQNKASYWFMKLLQTLKVKDVRIMFSTMLAIFQFDQD